MGRMRMRMAPVKPFSLSIALLLVVALAAGCALFIQCEAQTIRQDRLNELCDKLDDRLRQTDITVRDIIKVANEYKYLIRVFARIYDGQIPVINNPGKVAESIFEFCKNNAGE